MLTKVKSVVAGAWGRLGVVLGFALLGLASAQTTGEITEAQFTELSTQILTYLGYAIGAGLLVLVAVIGARRAWAFMRQFL